MNILYLLLAVYLIPLIAYVLIVHTYKKYNTENNNKELSGFEIARNILDKHNLEDMYIIEKRGMFTDTYDSKQNVIRLSTPVFHEESVYSLAVASYLATKSYLYNKQDKTIKTKIIVDNFINVLITFIYLLLLVGIIINSLTNYKVVLCLLISVIIYNLRTTPIEDKIMQKSLKELKNNKISDKNIEQIKSIYSIMRINGLAQMVISLSNLYYTIKEDAKK